MSMPLPQGLYEWLAAVSVPTAGYAVKRAFGVVTRLAVLERDLKATTAKADALDAAQRKHESQLAVHDTLIAQITSTLVSISAKMESLPRIASTLETIVPKFDKVVSREELDARFANIQKQLDTITHLD